MNPIIFSNVFASEAYFIPEDHAHYLKLSRHPGWLALLHYRKNTDTSAPVSEADVKNFFVSPHGKSDPYAEIIASISAMLTPKTANDIHFQCRFPARAKWLSKQLGLIDKQRPKVTCQSLQDWHKKLLVDHVMLVFPSSYLGAPSSMFGHLFLRFGNNRDPDRLNSPTFNYAAVTTSEDGSHSITGGLFSGLPSDFSIKPYYLKLKEYGYMENRDIWEYKLKLNKSEIEMLILHLWELQGHTFDYFFLDENCAYRILSVIEAVKPSINLTQQFQTTALPTEIIAGLEKAGLIQKAEFTPSSYRQFLYKTEQLASNEKDIIRQLAHGEISPVSKQFDKTDNSRKFHLLGLAIEYLNFIISADNYNRAVTRERLHKLIVTRAKYSPSPSQSQHEEIPMPARPEHGHSMSRFSLQRSTSDDDLFTNIKLRYAYHNLHDPLTGYFPGSEIEVMQFNVQVDDEQLKLQQFDLLSISSLMPVSDFFSPVSWHLSMGSIRSNLNNNKVGAYGRILVGKTIATDSVFGYAIAGLSLLQGTHLNDNYAAGPQIELGVLYYLSSQTGQLKYIATSYLAGHDVEQQTIQFTHSLALARNVSIDAQVQREYIDQQYRDQTSLQLNLFF